MTRSSRTTRFTFARGFSDISFDLIRPIRRMRVMYLSAAGELGGAERSLLDILASIRQAQPSWALHLLTAVHGPLAARAAELGVTTEEVPFDAALSRVGEFGAGLSTLAGLPPAGDVVRIGLLGTFARWKGHITFLEAVARLPRDLRVRAYVIGGALYQTAGSQYTLDELRRHAAALGLSDRVGFTGFVTSPDEALRALDIVVHASTAPEPFGLVIAEAMACGRAVIASDAGGAREILTPGVDALGHTPGSASGLAARIVEL